MLGKKHRLAKTKDVKLTFERGRAFFNPLFTLKFLKKPQPPARFAVVVSTKVSKKAVARNRIKRHIREFVRLNIQRFVPGDYSVVVKPAAANVEGSELKSRLSQFLASCGLLS